MLNDAATKIVARAARVAAKESKDRIARGANVDTVLSEAWRVACAQNAEIASWPSARDYFETVFLRHTDA